MFESQRKLVNGIIIPTVKLFTKNELRPIKDVTAYHSPEVSETDDENADKRKIVTKDLRL